MGAPLHNSIVPPPLSAVDDPSLSQLSTAGLIFVVVIFVAMMAAVAIPTWRRSVRRREREDLRRREARIAAAEGLGVDPNVLRARVREDFEAALGLTADGRGPGRDGRRIAEAALEDVQVVRVVRDGDSVRAVAAVSFRSRPSRPAGGEGARARMSARRSRRSQEFWTFARGTDGSWRLAGVEDRAEGQRHLRESPLGA